MSHNAHAHVLNLLLLLLGFATLLAPREANASCTPPQYSHVIQGSHIQVNRTCATQQETSIACKDFLFALYGSREGDCFYGVDQDGNWYGAAGWHGVPGSGGPVYFLSINFAVGEVPRVEKNLGRPKCEALCFGDPVNAGSGNKFHTQNDYLGPGRDALHLQWTYNSTPSSALASNKYIFGRKRAYQYSQSIETFAFPNDPRVAYVTRPDGNSYRFEQISGTWVAQSGIPARLTEVHADGLHVGWALDDGEATEIFNASGRLEEISTRSGARHIISYDTQGRIDSISDRSGRKISFGYNGSGLVESALLPDGVQITYGYSAERDMTETHYSGGSIRYRYDEAGLVAASTAPGALTGIIDESEDRYSTTTYDARSYATGTSVGSGQDEYAANYQLSGNKYFASAATISLPAGGAKNISSKVVNGLIVPESVMHTCVGCIPDEVTYTYDDRGHTDLVQRNQVVTDHDYDESGLLVQKIEADNDSTGNKRTFQTDWHPVFRLPTEQRVLGSSGQLVFKRNLTYNLRGQELSATSHSPATGEARTTGFAYCEQADIDAGTCPLEGLIKSVDGPRTGVSDVIIYTYRMAEDASCATAPATCPYRKGDLWKVTSALGHVTETLKYDGAGRVLSVKDPNGIVSDFEYHPRGWLTARKVRGTDNAVETDDQVTGIDYWPTGLVKKVTQPDGAFTAYTYDAAHRLTDITDNAGNTIHYVLDNAGNRLQEDTKDPGGALKRTLSRVYNQLGQLESQADAQTNPTDFTYDANGNTDTVTDALLRVTDNDHDPLNRLSRTLQDVGGIAAETSFQYDALDNLTKVTDPKGLDTNYEYNGFGELTELASPDTGTTTYTYDTAGNRKTQTDARGITTTYGYDALNRLTTIAYSDGMPGVTYDYDSNNPMGCGAHDQFSKGRLKRITDASGTTHYCYDRFGNLVRKGQTTNGKAFTLRYAYTKAGQLSSVTYPGGTLVDYVRNAIGQVTEVGVTRSGSARQVLLHQAGYLPFGPAAGWTYGNGRQLARSYDQDYQPAAILDAATGGLSVGFGFNAVGNLDKLTTATSSTPLASFDYDPLNRLTHFRDGPTQVAIDSYTYDKTGNRTSFTNSAGTQPYTYPATSHRLTEVGAVGRGYDAAGNTTAIGGAAREFVYNGAGRLSQVKANGIVLRQYAYNGKGEQVRKFLGSANTYTVYDEAGHWLGDYDTTGAPLQQAIWLDDLPVGLLAGATQQLHYIEPDHLGTPRVVIDPVRDVAVWNWDLRSEAFGNSPPHQDPDGDGTNFVLDMRFPGQRYDAASGLNYNYYRDGYDAGTGRYTQSDPTGLQGGVSTYAYVESNPLLFTDYLGLGKDQACVGAYTAAGAVCGGAVGYYGGGVLGAAGGGLVCSPLGPGAAACAAGGAAGGSSGGGLLGSAFGGALGNLAGQAMCPNDDCDKYVRQINALVAELKKRYSDLVLDPRQLPATGPMSVAGHQQQFRNKQARLRRLLQEAASQGCSGFSPDAWTWATLPAPGRGGAP